MNPTLSVDEQVVERARETAKALGTSLNDLIRKYLESLAGERSGEEVARQMVKLWNESSGNSRGWKFNREELYDEVMAERFKGGKKK